MNQQLSEDQEKQKSLREELLDKFSTLISAAFGLVAALAWNEAIKELFKEIFGTTETLIPMITYATIVTILAVILTFLFAKGLAKAKAKTS